MAKLAQRQIIAEITALTNDNITGPNLSGFFAQVSGGEITAAVEKIYVGGLPFPQVLCAPSEVGDVTLTRHYDSDFRTLLQEARLVVGRAYYEIKIYDTNCNIIHAIDFQYKINIDAKKLNGYVIFRPLCFQDREFSSNVQ